MHTFEETSSYRSEYHMSKRGQCKKIDVDKDEYGTDLIDSNEIKLVIKYNITPIAEQDLLTLTLGENVQ